MKPYLLAVLAISALCSGASRSGENGNPFVEPKQAWHPSNPSIIRTMVEFIELSRENSDALLYGDDGMPTDEVLREKVADLMTRGEAKLLDHLCLTSRMNGTVQSGPFIFIPSEYTTAFAPDNLADFKKFAPPGRNKMDYVSGPCPTDWYNRDFGTRLQIETHDVENNGTLRMDIDASITGIAGETIHQKWKDSRGTADIRTVIPSSMAFSTTLKLRHGKPTLAAVHAPCDISGVPDPSRMIMAFVRADQLVSPLSPEERTEFESWDSPIDPAADPFAEPDPSLPVARPKLIRTTVEFIKVPMKRQVELLNPVRSGVDDDAMHDEVEKMITSGDASVLETLMFTGNDNTRTEIRSGNRSNFPSDYDYGKVLEHLDEHNAKLPDVVTPPFPTNWEGWQDGPHLTTNEMLDDQSNRIIGHFGLRWFQTTGETVWRDWKDSRGDHSVRTPNAHSQSIEANIMSHSEKWLLMASLTPHDQKPDQIPTHKILVFVKSDSLTVKSK